MWDADIRLFFSQSVVESDFDVSSVSVGSPLSQSTASSSSTSASSSSEPEPTCLAQGQGPCEGPRDIATSKDHSPVQPILSFYPK